MSLRDSFLPQGASPIAYEVRALLRSNSGCEAYVWEAYN